MSDRDKRILIILLIFAILGGAFWGAKTLSEKNDLLKDDVRDLKARHSDLVVKNASKKTYDNDTATNIAAFNKVFADYNSVLSQDRTLIFLAEVEKNTGVWLKQTSLDTVAQVYKFGAVKSTNPSSKGKKVYETDNTGVSTTINVSYECTYDQLKAVLEYLRTNGRKATITNMSLSYDQGAGIVSGSMSITFYAITGSDRPVQNVDIQDVFVGTGNIFNSETFISNGADVSMKDRIIAAYDMFVIVNRAGADQESVIVGKQADSASLISSTNVGIENVTIKVTGRAGAYQVSYQIGAIQYPAENYEVGDAFVCGDSIELLIMSSERGNSSDTNEIRLRIINETDIVVNAAVISDDPTLPRVKLEEAQGSVVFH